MDWGWISGCHSTPVLGTSLSIQQVGESGALNENFINLAFLMWFLICPWVQMFLIAADRRTSGHILFSWTGYYQSVLGDQCWIGDSFSLHKTRCRVILSQCLQSNRASCCFLRCSHQASEMAQWVKLAAAKPESGSQEPCGRRRELISKSLSLISTHIP